MIKYICLILLLSTSDVIFALDTIRSAINVSESAIKAQRERVKVISQNLANENTTSTMPGGDPPKRKIIHFKEKFDPLTKEKIIKVTRYGTDKSPFKIVYEPGHPAADEKGLLKYPNIDRNIELRDSLEAERSIEANAAVIETSKKIINNLLDLIK